MEATLYILIKKYPSLAYFDIRQAITEEQLLTIAPEINQPSHSMTLPSRQVHKLIRKHALWAQQKVKQGRKLYKALEGSSQFTESIILNNANLKTIEALECRHFDSLTEIQLASNEIRTLTPLKRTKMPQIQQIDLRSNLIESLHPLKEVHWPKLRVLNLNHNNIHSIQGLPLHSFTTIKTLNLSDNFLRQMKWLRKTLTTSLTHLKHLNLASNEILDVRWLSECHFHKLQHLNLRNNKYGTYIGIEKIRMTWDEEPTVRLNTSHYEILVSSLGRWSCYTIGYRKLSRHKLSVQAEPQQTRSNRQNIQKSRKLILY